MSETEDARQNVFEVMESLRELNRELSRSYALDLFFSAKYEELTALFLDSNLESQAHNLLVQVDPSHSSEYNELVQ